MIHKLGLVDAKLITDDVKEALLQGELNIHNLTTPNMLCKQCEFKERCGGAWTAACNNPQCTKGKPHLELKYSDQKDSGVVLPCEVQDGRRFLNNLQIVKIGAGSKRSQLSPRSMRLMAISSPHSDDQPIAFGLSDEFKVPSNKSRSKEERKQSQMLRNRRHNINQQCTRQMKKQSVQNNHHPKQPSQKLKKQQNTYMPLLPFTSDDFRPNEILHQITQNQYGNVITTGTTNKQQDRMLEINRFDTNMLSSYNELFVQSKKQPEVYSSGLFGGVSQNRQEYQPKFQSKGVYQNSNDNIFKRFTQQNNQQTIYAYIRNGNKYALMPCDNVIGPPKGPNIWPHFYDTKYDLCYVPIQQQFNKPTGDRNSRRSSNINRKNTKSVNKNQGISTSLYDMQHNDTSSNIQSCTPQQDLVFKINTLNMYQEQTQDVLIPSLNLESASQNVYQEYNNLDDLLNYEALNNQNNAHNSQCGSESFVDDFDFSSFSQEMFPCSYDGYSAQRNYESIGRSQKERDFDLLMEDERDQDRDNMLEFTPIPWDTLIQS